MFKQTSFVRTCIALVAASVMVSGCGGTASQATGAIPQSHGTAAAPTSYLTKTDLTASSVSSRAGVMSRDRDCNGSQDNCDSYSLRVPLQISYSGVLSIANGYPSCRQLAPWDGPWYIAFGTFSLPVAQTTVPACAEMADADSSARLSPMQTPQTPFPSATPSPTPAPTATPPSGGGNGDLYIVRLEIGWTGVSVTRLAGPATTVDGSYVFPALVNSQKFEGGGLYSYFIARANGN